MSTDNFVYFESASFIINKYLQYLKDRKSLSQDWVGYFNNLSSDELKELEKETNGPSWSKSSELDVLTANACNFSIDDYTKIILEKEKLSQKNSKENIIKIEKTSVINESVLSDIALSIYLKYSHIYIDEFDLLNPLNENKKAISFDEYLQKEDVNSFIFLKEAQQCSEYVAKFCKKTEDLFISSNFSVELEHLPQIEKNWIIEKIKKSLADGVSLDSKKEIMNDLIKAEMFEEFMHKKFSGAKRFSVEGGESSIVFIKSTLSQATNNGVKDCVIGMAHRGRLNILHNIAGKDAHKIFAEFSGKYPVVDGAFCGDVKYHNGYSNDVSFNGKDKIHLSLCFNPSHLEAVNPVVLGKSRANQDFREDFIDRQSSMSLLIHGDAAVIGQGVVTECLNMSQVDSAKVGGTVHLIINNQVGFTASSQESRSSRYASDVAKIVNCPVFHINGDSPEMAYLFGKICSDYRKEFKKDIFVDLICYRKYGHNEGDEPLFTQPKMYQVIKNKEKPSLVYAKFLNDKSFYDKCVSKNGDFFDKEYEVMQTYQPKLDYFNDYWSGMSGDIANLDCKTSISKEKINSLIQKITSIPNNFNTNSKVAKQLEERLNSSKEDSSFDWGTAELLAYASLVDKGTNVRISGQDSQRGTFSHRHSVLTDGVTEERINVMNDINGGRFFVYNSVLSEYSVLGFEYGYSLSSPNSLTIWEAQFGDFANGASTIFDQFIASSEVKWRRFSNLVVLLPHGYEGQGPEHSSARVERFLQLCADNNMIVANCTTPANLFHILRRQVVSNCKKPLVIFTPKSLLRHKMAISKISDFSEKNFSNFIIDSIDDSKVERVLLMSGKIYYDISAEISSKDIKNIAIIRLEQLYPLNPDDLVKILKRFNKVKEIFWVQEEPKNMGAWQFINEILSKIIAKNFNLKFKKEDTSYNGVSVDVNQNSISYIGRCSSASPSTGYTSVHNKQQLAICELSLN